jgi:hypothetical protein
VTTTQSESSTNDQSDLAVGVPARSLRNVRPERRVALLAILLIAVAGALFLTLPDPTEATRPSPAWAILVLLLAFAAAEFTVFAFIFRRESMGFSLSEIPLAFSLVYLAPGPTLTVRVLGAIAVVLLIRRPAFYKVALNVGLFTFEVALAYVVFR